MDDMKFFFLFVRMTHFNQHINNVMIARHFWESTLLSMLGLKPYSLLFFRLPSSFLSFPLVLFGFSGVNKVLVLFLLFSWLCGDSLSIGNLWFSSWIYGGSLLRLGVVVLVGAMFHGCWLVYLFPHSWGSFVLGWVSLRH